MKNLKISKNVELYSYAQAPAGQEIIEIWVSSSYVVL